jgi:hypothetical protein
MKSDASRANALIRYLLDAGCESEPSVRWNFDRPLIKCFKAGNVAAIRLLLKVGADLYYDSQDPVDAHLDFCGPKHLRDVVDFYAKKTIGHGQAGTLT